MIPDRIGIIGSTHGESDSSAPSAKKVTSTAAMLPSRRRTPRRSCSETNPAEGGFAALIATVLAEGSAEAAAAGEPELFGASAVEPAPVSKVDDAAAPPGGRVTLIVFVIGG